MSAIDAIGGSSAPASSAGFGLKSEEYFNLVLAELQNQDPLEPNDTSQLLEDIGLIQRIETDRATQEAFATLTNQSAFASAASLVGNLVGGISTDNRRVADLVISVSNTKDGPMLNLFDGSRLPFSQVDEIAGPLDFGDDTGSGGETPGTDEPDPDDGSGDDSGGDSGGDDTGDETSARTPDDATTGDPGDAVSTSTEDRINELIELLKRETTGG